MKTKIEIIKNHAMKMRDFVLDILFPIECLSCGMTGDWLCHRCYRSIKITNSQYCPACGRFSACGATCSGCRDGASLDGLLAAARYNNLLVSRLIKSCKYDLAKDIYLILGKILVDLFNEQKLVYQNPLLDRLIKKPSRFAVVSVPLHPRRERERGFNQAELIAQVFAAEYRLPVLTEVLKRTKNVPPQAKLKSEERPDNVADCFAISGDAAEIKDKIIFLVDDVVTSGATMQACASVLKAGGARAVWGVAVARR